MSYLTTTLASFLGLIPVTLAQSLILSFLVVGIMLPFRLLNFPDMTCEGTYPLGGCLCAALMAGGMDPLSAIALAVVAGMLAGCLTAYLHLRFRIHTLLAGILVMTMLYSVDLRIMGRSNVSIFGQTAVFEMMPGLLNDAYGARIAIAGVMAAIVLAGLYYFFQTEKGIATRAVGANPDMAEAQGIRVWTITIGGVGAASAFAALSGALMTQSQGFGDVNMGLGILVNGLAALMIGEAIVGRDTVWRQLLAPFVGSIAFYQALSLLLAAGMPPPDLKLITGLFVLSMLALPHLRRPGAGTRKPTPAAAIPAVAGATGVAGGGH